MVKLPWIYCPFSHAQFPIIIYNMIKTIEQNPDIYNKVSLCEQNYQLFKKLNSPFGEIVILKSYVTLQEIFVKEKRFKCFETFKENITRAK